MANPYDIDFTVPASMAPLQYGGHCYMEGDVIKVKQADKSCFMEQVFPAYEGKCFPEYCLTDDGYSPRKHTIPVEVPAGEVAIHVVPSIEGCAPPNMVCFEYCAACLYVGYDAAPIVDPADPEGQAGGGADFNPTCRDLIENGVCVETIQLMNPADAPILVMMSYYC